MQNKIKFKTLEWKFRDTTIHYPELSEIPKKKIISPKDIFELFRPLFDEEAVEVFVVVWLSSANKIIGFETVSRGTLTCSVVDPRSVFKGAVVANATNIIVMHNHPSTNPEPSEEDIIITRKLADCGKLFEIQLYDHIIFAGDSFTSFVERRLL